MIRATSTFSLLLFLWSCRCGVTTSQQENGLPRKGGIQWDDLSVSKQSSKYESSGNSFILHSSTGKVANGHVCGIIGPSGAGKSTLLTALAGTTSKSAALHVSGSVWVENRNGTKSSLSIRTGEVAFLQQHDIFFSMLSSRETLDLAAFLELPSSTIYERNALVEYSLDALGLASVQHRKIGDRTHTKAGLSGGERRRLSVALELLTTPKIFLADEPTTGLDSTQAQKVVNLMARLAKERNIPCLLSLHQPRASIWKKLDSFILLAPGGQVCYMGDRKEGTRYFAKLGYICPPETNPAEYFIELVSIDTEDPVQAKKDRQRITGLAEAFALHTQSATHVKDTQVSPVLPDVALSNDVAKSEKPSVFQWTRRLGALLLRSWRQNIRNSRVNGLRLGTSIGQALLLSQIFTTVRKGVPTAKSVGDRTALLSFSAVNMSMMALTKTLDLFAKEKGVVMREQTKKLYSSWEYLLSKVIAELPLDACFAAVFSMVLKATTGLRIPLAQLMGTFSLMTVAGASLGFAVGSLTPNAESAMATGVPLLVIMMVVGVINPSGIDKTRPPSQFIKYLKAISPIRWAIEALCVGEYQGMVFEHGQRRFPWQKLRDLPQMGAFVMVRDGGQVLSALGLEDATYPDLMKNLAKLSGVQLLLSWIGLHYGGTKFVEASSDSNSIAREKVNSLSGGLKDHVSTNGKNPFKVPAVRKI